MAQTYTLDEAALKLGVSAEELKRRLREDWKSLRPFRDGASFRFRTQEIDDLARSLGRGSGDDLPLGDVGGSKAGGDAPPVDPELSLTLDDAASPLATPPKPADKGDDTPLIVGEGGEAFKLVDDPPAKVPTKSPSSSGDSDVRLDRAAKKSDKSSDSDVKLEHDTGKLPKKPAGKPNLSDEIDLDDSFHPEGAPSPSKSGVKKGDPSTKKVLPPKTGPIRTDQGSSEFELTLAPDDDESIDLGKMPKGPGRGADSGINLQRPADSGISLERANDDEIDFELNLDSESSQIISSKSSKNLADANSEFELTLDDEGDLGMEDPTTAFQGESAEEGQKDIFETDFEIPAIEEESASEAVALEEGDTDLESSDFDLEVPEEGATEADDSSGSQVVAVEEDEEAAEAVVGDEEELEGGASASSALRGYRGRGDDEDEDDVEAAPVGAGSAPAVPWGPVPLIALFPTVIVMALTGLMGYELLRGMWGYQQPSKSTAVITGLLAKPFMDDADYKSVFGGD
jgi:hypothetical protein